MEILGIKRPYYMHLAMHVDYIGETDFSPILKMNSNDRHILSFAENRCLKLHEFILQNKSS